MDLEKVKGVLTEAMRHEGAQLLFNVPVDYKGLGLTDYRKFVKQPMDLGTIAQKLTDGQYETSAEVKSDADLIWSNCLRYNRRPIDQPTRDICTEVQEDFDRLWAEAGLDDPAAKPKKSPQAKTPSSAKSKQALETVHVTEKDVPDQYNLVQEEGRLPARSVTDFFFCSANDNEKLVLMKARNKLGSATLCGTLQDKSMCVSGTKGNGNHFIQTTAVIEWCHQYGPNGGIWVLTKNAWYRLGTPAKSYQDMFQTAALRFKMCSAAIDIVQEDPEMDISEASERVLAAYQNEPKLHPRIRSFLASQLETWVKNHMRESEAESLDGNDALLSPPATEKKKRARSEEMGLGESPPSNAKRRKVKGGSGKAAQSPPNASKAGRQRKQTRKDSPEAPPPAAKKITKAQRDREANQTRGPPPTPTRSQRTPPELLPDVIAVWEFLQSFSNELQIAPFPLWRLEAALSPGPHRLMTSDSDAIKEPAAENVNVLEAAQEESAIPEVNLPAEAEPENGTDKETGAETEKSVQKADDPEKGGQSTTVPSSQPPENKNPDDTSKVADSDKRRKKKRGRPPKLKAEVKAQPQPLKMTLKVGGGSATNSGPQAESSSSSPPCKTVDREGAASALILRDVHCALLKAAEGGRITSGKAAPTVASLLPPPDQAAKIGNWAQRTVDVILKSPEPVPQETWDAALFLAGHDYWQLAPKARVALLSTLVSLALNNDSFHNIIQTKAESIPVFNPAPPPKEDPVSSPQTLTGSLVEWEEWTLRVRKSWRKPLGIDFDKRRYWVLGNSAAWTIFVEDQDGQSWGWYVGKQICELVAWLKSGGIDRENALIKALSSAPLIRTPASTSSTSSDPVAALPALTVGSEKAVEEASQSEIENRQADGFKGKCAPYLRGVLIGQLPGQASSLPQQIQHCIDAMLGELPFWFKGLADVQARAALLVDLHRSATVGDLSACLLKVERLLYEGSCLTKEWALHWQKDWREDSQSCSNIQDCALLTASLQEHVVNQECVLSRAAFLKVHSDNNCQLKFPTPGTELVFFRSGILQHIKQYMQVLGLEAMPSQDSTTDAASLIPERPKTEAASKDEARAPQTLDTEQTEATVSAKESPAPDLQAESKSQSASLSEQMLPNVDPAPARFEDKIKDDKAPLLEKSEAKLEEGIEDGSQEHAQSNKENADGALNSESAEQQIQAPVESQSGLEAGQVAVDDEMKTEAHQDINKQEGQPVKMATPADNLAEDQLASLRAEWDRLKSQVEDLQHVEQFKVLTVAYRRNLLYGSAAFAEESSNATAELTSSTDAARWPVAWMLLKRQPSPLPFKKPSTAASSELQAPGVAESEPEDSSAKDVKEEGSASKGAEEEDNGKKDLLVIPLRIYLGLPDYTASVKEYKNSMKLTWRPGQRFQMFFAGKKSSKSKQGGVYYKGTIVSLTTPPDEQSDAVDPWESIQVQWDASRANRTDECQRVSPWEIERDPEDVFQIQADKAAQKRQLVRSAWLEALEQPVTGPATGSLGLAGLVPHALPTSAQNLPPTASNAPLQAPASQDLPLNSLPPVFRPSTGAAINQREERQRKRKRLDDDMDYSQGEGEDEEEWVPSPEQPAFDPRLIAALGVKQSTAVPQEVLGHLKKLSKEQFVMLVGNWHRLTRGKFKVPKFAHEELDLSRVFWEVQGRGGSDAVTNGKLWKDVCRSLGVNLEGQTSASYNLRQNYEKCLTGFEHYLAGGQYLADRAANRQPSADRVQNPRPGTLSPQPSQLPTESFLTGISRRSLRLPQRTDLGLPGFPSNQPASSFAQAQNAANVTSFTQLLAEGNRVLAQSRGPPALQQRKAEQPGVAQAYRQAGRGYAPWQRLVGPPGAVASADERPGKGWTAQTMFLNPVAYPDATSAHTARQAVQPAARTDRSHPTISHQITTTQSQAVDRIGTNAPRAAAPEPAKEQDPVHAFMQLLQAGYSAGDLHRLIEQAANNSAPVPIAPSAGAAGSNLAMPSAIPQLMNPVVAPAATPQGLPTSFSELLMGGTTRPDGEQTESQTPPKSSLSDLLTSMNPGGGSSGVSASQSTRLQSPGGQQSGALASLVPGLGQPPFPSHASVLQAEDDEAHRAVDNQQDLAQNPETQAQNEMETNVGEEVAEHDGSADAKSGLLHPVAQNLELRAAPDMFTAPTQEQPTEPNVPGKNEA